VLIPGIYTTWRDAPSFGVGCVGLGAFGSQLHGLTGLISRLGAVSTAFAQDDPPARDALAAKPHHGSYPKADSSGLFRIDQDLCIVKPCCIVHGDVGFS